VPVAGADGKDAKRDSITLHRPNVAHAKQLAVLIGPKLAQALMGEVKAGIKDVDMTGLLSELTDILLTEDGLESLTAIIAGMAREDKTFIDQLDWLDLISVGKAFLDFFPALRSIALSSSPQT
jgi:hypothetical protein